MVAYTAIDRNSLEKSISRKISYFSNKHYSRLDVPRINTMIESVENGFGEKIVKVTGSIPADLHVNKGDSFLFISTDQSKYLHSIHRYPAKFFPELPRWLIEKYSEPGDTVLDPFAGSGTTNLESILLGRNTIAVDIEQFCHLLIKVKSTPIDNDRLEKCNKLLLNRILNYNPNLVDPDRIPSFPYRDNWFQDYILYELEFIRSSIDLLINDKAIRDFYLVCFSSIIRGVSNADDGCTRTVVRKKLQKDIHPSMAIVRFLESVLVNTFKMNEFHIKMADSPVQCKIVRNSDAKSIQLDDDSVDAAITSPPYVNAVDYPRTHQLELYWLGFESGSLTPLKKKHVGTEAVSVAEYSRLHYMEIESIDDILKRLFDLDSRRSYIAYKYLVDMQANLAEVYRVLKPGKRYAIVVGNNRIRGIVFETWKYLCLIAEKVGFEVETWFISEVIKHFIKVPRDERIDQDYIIVLRKPQT